MTSQRTPFNPSQYEAVFFDLDGTLVDTLADLHSSLVRTLEHFHLPTSSIDSTRKNIGDGVAALIQVVCGEGNTPSTPFSISESQMEEILAYFENDYHHHCTEFSCLYPDVISFLKKVTSTKPIAMISNKPQYHCDKIVRDLKIENFFTDVLGGDLAPKYKPHPDGILLLCQRHGWNPHKVLMIGDAWQDMAAGRAAGCSLLGKTGGYGNTAKLSEYPPDSWFNIYRELI